jgi:hypothetical protein
MIETLAVVKTIVTILVSLLTAVLTLVRLAQQLRDEE